MLSKFSLVLLAGLMFTPLVASLAETEQFQTAQSKMHYDKAIRFSEKSDWNGVVLELNRALQYEPRNPLVLMELRIAYGELKQWERAIQIHKKVLDVTSAPARTPDWLWRQREIYVKGSKP